MTENNSGAANSARTQGSDSPETQPHVPKPWTSYFRGSKAFFVAALLVSLVILALFGPRLKVLARQLMCYRAIQVAATHRLAQRWDEAIHAANEAVSWLPDDGHPYLMRGELRRDAPKGLRDLQGSLDDFNQLIKLSPYFATGFAGRARTLQRLGRHQEAIDDYSSAIRLSAEDDDGPWNARAYARALARIDLEAALEDVERAIRMRNERAEGEGFKEPAIATYLDTRGYILHLLGHEKEALTDLDKAIEQTENERELWEAKLDSSTENPDLVSLQKLAFEQTLAVMYHHRGEIHQAMGHDALSSHDLNKADTLGFDPDNGVF